MNFWRSKGDGADRRRWRSKGGGGPPARGLSRSDKGSAGSGEEGKVTSGQEGLQPVAPLRSQDRLAFLPTAKPFRRFADTPITFQGIYPRNLCIRVTIKIIALHKTIEQKFLSLGAHRRNKTATQNNTTLDSEFILCAVCDFYQIVLKKQDKNDILLT